jgi:hypothetical protein
MSNPSVAQKPDAPRSAFIFIGPPHHGKTLARKIFCELTGMRGGSCSDVIYAILSHFTKTPVSELQALPKEELRPRLIELGDYLCGARDTLELNKFTVPDNIYRGPSALLRSLFHTGALVFDGVRRKDELAHFAGILTWLGIEHRVLWVERPGCPTVSDNTEVTVDDATVVVVNDGTPSQLRAKIEALVVPPQPAEGDGGEKA